MLHIEAKEKNPVAAQSPPTSSTTTPIATHAAMGIKSNLLLEAIDGSTVEALTLLDSAFSASFVSKWLAQSLQLTHSYQNVYISRTAGLTCNSPAQHIAIFTVSFLHPPSKKLNVSAIIVTRIMDDLSLHPIPLNPKWDHSAYIQLADPGFGEPGKIDLLVVEVFVEVIRHGWRL